MTNRHSDAREARLQQVIALSQQMLDSADRGEWERFADLERLRRPDMLACFEQPVAVSEAAMVRTHLEQLMSLNERLTGVLRSAREESARQFQALKNGRSAVQAYSTR